MLIESAGVLWGREIPSNTPRRHSYPLKTEHSESTGDEEESDDDSEVRVRKRSSSLSNSPYRPSGMPLGSKAAQEAAKSFWNMDMLQESLQKIVQYAANDQSSGLGSSLASVDVQIDESAVEDQENPFVGVSPIAPHLKNLPLSLSSCSAPTSPRLSPPLSIQRSRSACSESPSKQTSANTSRNVSRKTSPYLSPASLKRVHFELSQKLDSASAPHLSVVGERIHLAPRLSRNGSHDDGFHDS